MRYSIALAIALSLPMGCHRGRELYSSPDNSVWVEKFPSGGHEVKIEGYLHNEFGEGDLVGLYTKNDPDPYIEFRPTGSVKGRIFINHPKRDVRFLSPPVETSGITVQEHKIRTDTRVEEYEFFRKQIEEARPKATVREE